MADRIGRVDMKSKITFWVMLVVLVAGGLAGAETLTLQPIEDAMIFGETEAGGFEARLLVKFDLTLVPRDARVVDASLYLDGVQIPNALGMICLYAAPLTTDWSSEDADWEGPGAGTEWGNIGGDWEYTYGDYGCLVAENERTPRLNLTTLIIGQLKDPKAWKGLVLFPTEYPDDSIDMQLGMFRRLKPRLEVRYHLGEDIGSSGSEAVEKAKNEAR